MKKTKNKLKIAVAMSGGVDSAVAAKLLKNQGHEVVGIFLHFWKEEIKGRKSPENKCCSLEALSDARRVAAKIGIPLYTLNFAKVFKKQVVDNFLAEYAKGKTPNPCVRCNKLVKLGFLIKQVKKLGFDYVASGHYLKKINDKLYRAEDQGKDQSYFLYTLSKKELAHLLFPLGNYRKTQVRQMAKKFKLSVAEKPESQEICFIAEKSHNEFLKRHLKLMTGPIKTLGGQTVGTHQGLPLYTIGQRKGIKIGGIGPFYAAKMDYKTNILFVVDKSSHPLICKTYLIAKRVNWLSGLTPKLPLHCSAAIRYHHKTAKCVVAKINSHNFKVKFTEPQRAIMPGQSVVFYRGKEILGGGVIK